MTSLPPGVGCLGLIVLLVLKFIFVPRNPLEAGETKSRGLEVWAILTGTGSTVVAFLTMGKMWLSDRHEFWAGMIGLVFYAALLAWVTLYFVPYIIAYGERPS